ncbi:molybdopterin biosynthesis protein MoeA/LysR substrate binding-domain-containing protein [Haloarcula vallismortis ATCC 29715]|uniref:Molybdopterin biosynthesis protein MoeA/LysR substrate binding-domain-containing protein n=1 Tax=Haloarcula vallismortis ATCC 29715 TaxID=662477 RepID=M0JM99_HALVA|nr:molybdopterin biosynthesis protein MoeA/LysR substrate binding-domain-containing protein [Haloarcula vallismortis ATCC 29715]
MVPVSDRREFRDLASPEEAHEVVAGLDIDPAPETVPLSDARDRVLAERVDADIDVPGFDRASMDGYAVRARDTFGADEADPVALSVAGEVHAGEEPDVTVESGSVAEISTGAVMPPGADAVVMVERTTETDDGVEIRTSVAPGDNVMLAGADIAAGARALGPGTRITPREIGLLSALGVDEVPVRGRPRVGILSTGDELVRPGNPLDSAAGQIYDVNSYTLAGAVAEAGGDPVMYPHAGDDYAEMERLLHEAADECDLVLSSGSTSASAVDVIYRVIEERGELRLHGVAVKPGKPMLVGTIGDSAYVGLPGYPVSALTIFQTFVAPAVRDAAGRDPPQTATVSGTMAVQERYGEGRRRLMPAGLIEDGTGSLLVYPVDKGSGATTSLVDADGFVDVPPGTDYLAEGETVDVTLFSPAVRPPTLLGMGEDDPLLSRLLDTIDRPRYLPLGSTEGLRRLGNGVPDAAVVAGPTASDHDTADIGGWQREWGLIVGPESDVAGLGDLVDGDYRFVNRDTASGLRRSFDDELDALGDERGVGRAEVIDAIDGYELTTKAHESPARKVLAGDVDAGLGLRATAAKLGLGFVPLGTQPVRVLANPDRRGKASVGALAETLDNLDSLTDGMAGMESQ